jgi:MarR family transcriptional regulator, organic hydroperoxide resistance regulator
MSNLQTQKRATADEINNRLFFRFFQAANTLHTQGTKALDGFGVTTQQWSVLGALSRPQGEQGMSVGDLSRYLLVSRQNLTGILDRLEASGAIERVMGEQDRRQRHVRLSAQGKKLWASLAGPIRDFYDHALQSFSMEDRLSFIHFITSLQKNMSQE